jgi:photosystem II stability/assembly factor-like uncharacterized protein
MSSGGPGSGLFKSTDGGATWAELTNNPGLPKGLKGKIGVVASPARSGRIWAIVEAEDGGLFRSDDGGATWERTSDDHNLRQRAWYYSHVIADPQDAETVWVLNVETWRSSDGGKTFVKVSVPHGDNHDLWIDPHNPQRMILGNDGGATVSFNGALSWSSLYTQPTCEFYHVAVDSRTPYRVYGAQQDNSTICVPSRSNYEAITTTEWYEVGGGESGYIAIRPDNPNIVYAGNYQGYLTRYDHSAGLLRNIMVWPEAYSGWGAKDQKYRFQWTSPTLLSPHDPNVLYTASNIIFRSTDEGASWQPISPDLTRNDPATLEPSGGPITKDNSGAEVYGTVFTLVESPLARGLLWAGSDDGLVQISRDGGQSWANVTPPALPEWALISIIEASPHDPATAYVAATRYKHDDFQPYLYKTNDYGQTWTQIIGGIPENDFTRVIRADPACRGLLYAGTETGIYVSFDDGVNWRRMGGNLPAVPIHDLAVKNNDLVVATHGRAFWILDDLTLIHQLADAPAEAAVQLFRPRDSYRFVKIPGYGFPPVPGKNYSSANALIPTYNFTKTPDEQTKQTFIDAGANPPDGVILHFVLKEQSKEKISLTILDAAGQEIKTFFSKPPEELGAIEKKDEKDQKPEDKEPKVPAKAGLNRFVWNMRYAESTKVTSGEGDKEQSVAPLAPPGAYQVRLKVGDLTFDEPFAILKDPRVMASQAELEEQFALLMRVRDKLSAAHAAVNQIRSVREQVEGWVRNTENIPSASQVAEAGKRLKERLAAAEERLIQVKARSNQDNLNFPEQLNAKLAFLGGAIGTGDGAPTKQAYALFDDLSAQVDRQLEQLRQVVEAEVAGFNAMIRDLSLPAVVVASKTAEPAK